MMRFCYIKNKKITKKFQKGIDEMISMVYNTIIKGKHWGDPSGVLPGDVLEK